jgi:rhamnose transport system permease protein
MTVSLRPPGDALADPIAGARRLADLVARLREFGIVVVLALFVGVAAGIQPRFLNEQNIKFILTNTTIYAFLALGETIVVVSRNIDLSVGSVLGLSAYVSSDLFSQLHGIPIPLVFLCGLGVGVCCGALNGFFVSIWRVPSLVVTLATLYMIRGFDAVVVGGGVVDANTLPNSFLDIATESLGAIPVMAIAVAIVVVAGAYYLRSFRSGRDLYAMGSSPEAARLAGIPIAKRTFVAFVMSGGIAGLAGVLWASSYQTIDSTAGTSYELTVVASVVVGGVAIFGGSGSAVGAALGALLLETINIALNVLGVASFWDQAIAGFLLLLAIALDHGIAVHLTAALRRRGLRRGA